ncbi:hypothetical protein OG455_17640 [Kitasatospora sp. NBC_01287]|uniref:hypothetical protein n=1 Tax=Kitasatospora sp. NBC_01287 TaxID=2903573 RepID=UPI002253C012|nr:hypothetical protein [Kitasatospora sp. NBC_01287]MCX4747322.1 hypothetical protein [Kitasatospora sp. NBC_01287]
MRITAAVAVLAVAATTLLTVSGTADATPNQRVIGTASTPIPAAGKGMKPDIGGNCGLTASCTSLTNGKLTVSLIGEGQGEPPYTVIDNYYKSGGGTITADFEYNAGSGIQVDQGAFQESSGQSKYFEWDYQYFSSCAQVVGILAVQGQGNFQTPPIYMC